MRDELTREDAETYLERWRLVRRRRREETIRLPMEERLARLALLMQVRGHLPDRRRSAEEAAIRDRWRRLREALLA